MYEVLGLVRLLPPPNGQKLAPLSDGGLGGRPPMLKDRRAETAWDVVPGGVGGELLKYIEVGLDGEA